MGSIGTDGSVNKGGFSNIIKENNNKVLCFSHSGIGNKILTKDNIVNIIANDNIKIQKRK